MRGILEPMFGEWGAQIVQFLVTATIVIVLVAIAYWLVRRYSLGGHGRVGRGRVPRLSIVDAMPVDARRRLVLVRRDNVEHLILVGGPSDLVVEQSIQRPRRPKATDAPGDGPGDIRASAEPVATAASENALILFPSTRAEAALAQTAPVPPPPVVHAAPYNGSGNGAGNGVHPQDRPFTFRRATAVAPAPAAARQPAAAETAPQAPARYVDIQRPTRIESAAIAAPASPPVEPEPMLPDLPTADLPPEPDLPATNGAGAYARTETDEVRAAPREPSPFAKPRAMEDDTAAKVSDLEREMARLLGEITQNRTS